MKRVRFAGWLLVLVWLTVPGSGRAQGHSRQRVPFEYLEIMGWTPGGRELVYEQGVRSSGYLLTKTVSTYVVSARGGEPRVLFDSLDKYQAWEGKWNIEGAEDLGDLGPVRAMIEAEGRAWTDENSRTSPFELVGAPGAKIRCWIKRGREVLESHTFVVPPHAAWTSVAFGWSPDAKRIVWQAWFELEKEDRLWTKGREVMVGGHGELVLDRTIGPRTEIVAGASVPQEVVDRAGDAIEAAGYAPTGARTEKTARDRSVVYAGKKWMKDGEAMAKVIPGGAEVKPLQGGGKYEVVVVLGRSALAGGGGPKK